MNTYRRRQTHRTQLTESVKNRLCGICAILFGILVSRINLEYGCNDITAGVCLCSLGLLMVVAKYE